MEAGDPWMFAFRLLLLLLNNKPGLLDQRQVVVLVFGPIDRVVPQIRRRTEPEEFHRFSGHAAFGEIIAGGLPGRLIEQAIVPALRNLFVNLKQLILEMVRLPFAGALVEFERNLGAVGETADGIQEADIFVFPDKGEHVATLVAAEAMENLPVGIDVEAGGFFLVKRAEGDEVCPRLFQRQTCADDVHDVAGGADAFEDCGRNGAGHAGFSWFFRAAGRDRLWGRRIGCGFAAGQRGLNQQHTKIISDARAGEGFVKNLILHGI